jgi:GST-like protein
VTHNWSGIDIEGLVNLQAWLERMAERPAVAKGRNIPERGSKSDTTKAGQKIIVT